MTTPPYIIFAHGRSGSTSLAHCLNALPSQRVAFEPFHPKFGLRNPSEPSYVDSIASVASLEAALEAIFRRYSGIKVLDRHLSRDLYAHLLLRPECKIIMLRRDNLLQAIISGLVAEQTRVWQRSDMTPERRARYSRLDPISPVIVRERLEHQAELQRYYRDVIRRRPEASWISVRSEDLVSPDLSRNRRGFRRVCAFLGVDIPDIGALDVFLDPQEAKITTGAVYRRIPNVAEINARCGDDETGWLFEP